MIVCCCVVQAVRLLRQSKALEGLLEKREVALDNLQTALQQIQMAETDKTVSTYLNTTHFLRLHTKLSNYALHASLIMLISTHTHTLCSHPSLHSQIVDAYKSSVRALKSVREGLTLEGVEETLEELRETMDDEGQEISSVLSEGDDVSLPLQ